MRDQARSKTGNGRDGEHIGHQKTNHVLRRNSGSAPGSVATASVKRLSPLKKTRKTMTLAARSWPAISGIPPGRAPENALPALERRNARGLRADALADEAGCVLKGGGCDARKRNDDEDRHQSRTDGEASTLKRRVASSALFKSQSSGRSISSRRKTASLVAAGAATKTAMTRKEAMPARMGASREKGHVALVQGIADLLLGGFFCFAFLVSIVRHMSHHGVRFRAWHRA